MNIVANEYNPENYKKFIRKASLNSNFGYFSGLVSLFGFGLTFPIGAHDIQIEANIAVIMLSLDLFDLGFFKIFSLQI